MVDKNFTNEKELRAPPKLYYSNEFAEYRHPLTTKESKVFTLICMQIEKGYKEGDYYRIPWECFKELGPNMDSKGKIIIFIKALKEKSIITNDAEQTSLFSYVSKARFSVGKYVDIAVHSELVELILTWKKTNYSTAHFECLFNFSNEHAWRLYFVLAQRAHEESHPLDITIELLRFYLNIDEDSPTYKNFGNLRTKILKVVQAVFKKEANFNFTFETIPKKTGRGIKVRGVRFFVGPVRSRQTTVCERMRQIIYDQRDERAKIKTIEMVKEKDTQAFRPEDEIKPLDSFKKVVGGVDHIGYFEQGYFKFEGLDDSHSFFASELEKKISAGEIIEF